MSRPPDPPDSPPQLERGKRAVGSGHASSTPPPPPGTRVTADAAVAASLAWDGDLAEDSPLRLAYLAAALNATGRLLLHGERASHALFFRRGTPVMASSNDARVDLARFLVERGAAAAPAVAAVEQERAEAGGDLVAMLAARGALNPADAFRFVQEHAILVVAHALAIDAGQGFWEPNAEPPASAFPLGPRFGLLSDAVRRMDALTVRRRLGPRARRAATRVGGRIAVDDLKLSALETRAAGRFDGVRSIAELAAANPAESDLVHRVALLLAETELLAFGAERDPAAAPAPATPTASAAPRPTTLTPPPTSTPIGSVKPRPTSTPTATPKPIRTPIPIAPAPAKPAPVATALGASGLAALAERLAGADHFQVLGVTRDAPLATLKAAYFQLARQVHPDAAAGEGPEVRQLRADLFARVSEAWNVLSDEAKRARYLEELAGGAPVDVAGILEAEQLFVQATVLVKTRQYPAALEALAKATQLHPDEPEFRVWSAWVEFLVATDRKAAHARSAAAIEAALKKSPRCMAAYRFLGQMAKLGGELDVAERHLKRGLALQPDPELERELKYLRK